METYKRLCGYLDDYCYNKSKLARKVGKDPRWIHNILTGRTNLKVEDFKNLCRAMGTDWLTVESYTPLDNRIENEEDEDSNRE